ncbi:MAG: TetR/AcrR family transcriptional regulator [Gammaproteobacteria bacterium]|nr:TetR/AcrR family transcriptional regulator [Gammaproteobacteria bacterium]
MEQNEVIRRPATRKQQRAASIEKIFDAALQLFVSRGYRNTTVEQIANEIGLTKGAVYFYFRTKEAIMLRLLEQAEEIVVERMIEDSAAAGNSARDKLVAFVHGQARLALVHPLHILLLILVSLEFVGFGGKIEDRIRDIYQRMYQELEAIIRLGQTSGEIRADVGTRELASMLMASHDGVFLEWYRRREELDGRELTRAFRFVLTENVLRETQSAPLMQ